MSRLAAKAKFPRKRKLLVMLKRFIRAIRLALDSPEITTRSEKDKREAVRRIVMRRSRGNIRLQRGRYATRKDLDERYERVKALNFNDE